MIYIFLLCLLFPLLEIYAFFYFSGMWGWPLSVLLTLASGFLGIFVIQREGVQALARLQSAVASGRSPAAQLLEGLILFLAGILLIVPGFVTDFLGLVLIMPYTRRWLSLFLQRKWVTTQRVWFRTVHFGGPPPGGFYRQQGPSAEDDIIEVEATTIEEIGLAPEDEGGDANGTTSREEDSRSRS